MNPAYILGGAAFVAALLYIWNRSNQPPEPGTLSAEWLAEHTYERGKQYQGD